MRPPYLLTVDAIASWPSFTSASPLVVLVSGCLAGEGCGVDGTSAPTVALVERLLACPTVRAVPFCPEAAAFGAPRSTPDLAGGNGFDVLDGRARVVNDAGADWTEGMVRGATEMRDLALAANPRLALLMDISAACGSSVIYEGPRRLRVYQRGPGVAAAILARAGLPIVSQRDERTLARVLGAVGANADDLVTDGLDHHERAWYRATFAI